MPELLARPREGLVSGSLYVEAVRDGSEELQEYVRVRGQRPHGGPTDPGGVRTLFVGGVGREGVQQVHGDLLRGQGDREATALRALRGIVPSHLETVITGYRVQKRGDRGLTWGMVRVPDRLSPISSLMGGGAGVREELRVLSTCSMARRELSVSLR